MRDAASSGPLSLVAELTHRCPLSCSYCSNPLELTKKAAELRTADWLGILEHAAQAGVYHVHFTGGEPLLRGDLAQLIAAARARDLYTNLITSGVPDGVARIRELVQSGLDAVQVSFQDLDRAEAAELAGRDVLLDKLAFARAVKDCGLALTVNVVLHRQNLARAGGFITLAEQLGAERLELAHVQYHGWALANRGRLLPTPEQLAGLASTVAAARARLAGTVDVLHVLPDYFSRWPKACMGGWGSRTIVVAPDGAALPCHSARSLPGLQFENAAQRPLREIWRDSAAFNAFRGTAWLRDPCRTCDRRELDYGGCRCQAFALTGDATAADPACPLSPAHAIVAEAREQRGPAAAPAERRRGKSLPVYSA